MVLFLLDHTSDDREFLYPDFVSRVLSGCITVMTPSTPDSENSRTTENWFDVGAELTMDCLLRYHIAQISADNH